MITIFLADLIHGSSPEKTFPYAAGCVGSYAKSRLGNEISVEVFRSPIELAEVLVSRPPNVVGFSNYAWNSSFSREFARRIKEHSPRTVIVMGGPNYPTESAQQHEFLTKQGVVDFYIVKEGEIPFAELLAALISNDLDVSQLKRGGAEIAGCQYIRDGELVNPHTGPKTKNLDDIPSPYLTGLLDKFFLDASFTPLTETKRGCPFSCTFCTEGLSYYSKLGTASADRFLAELEYIAERISPIRLGLPDLYLADANFGMYKEDLQMCEQIAKVQAQYEWPRAVVVSTGKNNKSRIIEAARITNRAFALTASLQSTDASTLANVKRTNISDSVFLDAARHNKDR